MSRMTRRFWLRAVGAGAGAGLVLTEFEACSGPAAPPATSVPPAAAPTTAPAPPTVAPAAAPARRTIRDMTGRMVQVPSTINRVATSYPIVTQMLHMLGAADNRS